MNSTQMPQVGTPLWFRPVGRDAGNFVRRDAQPLLALVIYVTNDRDVSVKVTDHDGHEVIRTNVPIAMSGDQTPDRSYCEWPSATVAATEPAPAPEQPQHLKPTGVALTEGDSLADLNDEPRPDNPGASSFEVVESVSTDVVDATTEPDQGDTPPDVQVALGTTTRKKR